MNPNNIKNPLDRAKFREQYLSNLRLQASNDQRNQNANSIFKSTGTTPSRPPDTRTTTERSADIEALKVDLRSKLGQITDGVIASQIVGELTPSQIRFAVDKWGTIEPDMKKQFASGVPTSAFIAYLNRLIEKFQLTDGVETGLQQSGNPIMSNTQILYGLPRHEIWNALRQVLLVAHGQMGINVEPALHQIGLNESIIPKVEDQQVLGRMPPELRAELMTIASRIVNNVASNNDIAKSISEIQLGIANRSKQYTQTAINNLVEMITLDESVLADRGELIDLVQQFITQGVQDDARAIEGGDNEEPIMIMENVPAEELLFPSPAPTPTEPEYGSARPRPNPLPETKNPYSRVPRHYTRGEWDRLGTRNKLTKDLFLSARLDANPDLILYNGNKRGRTPFQKGKRMPDYEKMTNDDLNALFDSYMEQTNLGMEGNGLKGKMVGKGLAVPKKTKVEKPYRQSIAHLVDKPVEKVKPYTQFGRYFINKHRLEGEGIVAFRQPSGNTIATLPTEKVSRPLANVMRTLVGKGTPSYNDIAELSKEDKAKLHYICHTCRVDNPAVPKMKGEGEQEEDRFNILRGEIIAGNDSPKIAKELKVMLMKFMNEGRIPRRQANEILQELLAMGL